MKIQITKRDAKFFVLGILTIVLIDLVLNWNDNKQAFMKGYNDAQSIEAVE